MTVQQRVVMSRRDVQDAIVKNFMTGQSIDHLALTSQVPTWTIVAVLRAAMRRGMTSPCIRELRAQISDVMQENRTLREDLATQQHTVRDLEQAIVRMTQEFAERQEAQG